MTVVHSLGPTCRSDNYVTSRSFDQKGLYLVFIFAFFLILFYFCRSMMVQDLPYDACRCVSWIHTQHVDELAHALTLYTSFFAFFSLLY